LVHEPTRKGGAPIGGDSDNNACAETKAMPANEIPPTLLYERGALNGIAHRQTNHLPPFLKGDRGGFCCAVVLANITAAYLLYKQSETIPPAQ
jgi:hypothetical protein